MKDNKTITKMILINTNFSKNFVQYKNEKMSTSIFSRGSYNENLHNRFQNWFNKCLFEMTFNREDNKELCTYNFSEDFDKLKKIFYVNFYQENLLINCKFILKFCRFYKFILNILLIFSRFSFFFFFWFAIIWNNFYTGTKKNYKKFLKSRCV